MGAPDAAQEPKKSRDVSTWRFFLGMLVASVFSLTYVITPLYIIAALSSLIFQFPSRTFAYCFAAPLFVSVLVKPIPCPALIAMLSPMLDFFEYEQIVESSPVDVVKAMLEGKKYIIACQPHGVISYCAICSSIYFPEFRCKVKLAMASAVLHTPILKHVIGIFGVIDASKASIKAQLSTQGVEGSVILYVGGIAELFMSCRKEERLFLSERKGFIKLALTEGVDVIPVYLFGNTSVLTVVKTGFLAKLSRKLQVSLTYFWGKYNLPIPRNEKLLYVSGQPLGLPHIAHPTRADIDVWHAHYCKEVIRIFDTYKERVPMYKHKKLIIT